jgi:hypothetical protein
VLGTVQPDDIGDIDPDPFGSKKFGKGLLTGVQQGVTNLGEVGLNVSGLGPMARAVGVPTSENGRYLEPVPGSGEPRAWVPEAIGRQVPALAMAQPGGLLGSVLTGALGGAADTGTPGGTALGAAAGGALHGAGVAGGAALRGAGSLVGKTAGMLDNPVVQNSVDAAAVLGVPYAGRVSALNNLRGRIGPKPSAGKTMEELKAIAAELEAAKKAAADVAEGKAHSVNSGLKPGPAGEAPAGTAASGLPPLPQKAPAAPSSSTGFNVSPTSTPQVSFKIAAPPVKGAEAAAAPAKPVAKETLDAAIERLKAATSPQERGAIIRELRGSGEKNIGEKLSKVHAEARPLDAEDLAQAKEILSQAGDLDKALKLLDNLEATPAERRSLARALREASRAK